ncbi:tetratricopeptide repeat protein [Variovorax sp. LARHSF232]
MFNALKRVLGLGGSPGGKEPAPRATTEAPASPKPTPKQDHLSLGNAAVQRERYAEAVEHYTRHIALEPSSGSGNVGLGFSLLQLGRFPQAIETLNNAVARDPQSGDGFYMLGQAYREMGQPQAALQAWRKAHALAPELEHLYLEFCLLLFNQGHSGEARTLMETGVARFTANADFKFYLGNLLAEGGDFASAAEVYRDAVALNGEAPYLLSSYANAQMQVGERDEAAAALKKAMALAPDDASIFSNYLLCIQYSTKLSKADKFQVAREFSERFETPLIDQWGRYEQDENPMRKLRLGYVSGDFRNHALAYFIEPILANHDRSKFELFCYYSHPTFDSVSQRVQVMADHWVGCHGMSDEALAERIRADQIDVLIDLSGHTGHNRLLTFARKPAPVQMTWLGFQASTGLRAMDYRITEEALDPTGASEQFHSEKLIRLPSSGTFSPSPDSPPVNGLPALGGQPFTFGCLNNPTKITDEAIALWASILQKSPNSRLLLGNATAPLIERFSAQFSRYGVDPARLVFHPKVGLVDYLALHLQIDLALDTFPYNGGTTTFHSLWMGVPLVALEGDSTLSKVGAAVMRGVGLPDFCATTQQHYVEQAVYFSDHLEELSAIRSSLRGKLGAITNHLAIEVTASLEGALQSCWQDYCRSRQAQAQPA